jgi:hypothetical protein
MRKFLSDLYLEGFKRWVRHNHGVKIELPKWCASCLVNKQEGYRHLIYNGLLLAIVEPNGTLLCPSKVTNLLRNPKLPNLMKDIQL